MFIHYICIVYVLSLQAILSSPNSPILEEILSDYKVLTILVKSLRLSGWIFQAKVTLIFILKLSLNYSHISPYSIHSQKYTMHWRYYVIVENFVIKYRNFEAFPACVLS
jgi:hypothetical protein